MSSTMGENGRAAREASSCGIVRRMVSLPRSIIGGFSRAMNQGIDLIGMRHRRHHQHLPMNFPMHYPQDPQLDEWSFLTTFEHQYGTQHPFFYACRFMDALNIAQNDRKFMFVYLHSPDHPFTASFCRETLCSDLVVQYLDANFVSWGAFADRGEGQLLVATFRPAGFPFCAVVAPAPGNSIAVLQQIEGPISPSEMVDILQRTLEEQGLAFGSARMKQEEKIKADRRIREEQDAAYLAALRIDKEKESKNSQTGDRVQNSIQASYKATPEKLKNNPSRKQYPIPNSINTEFQNKLNAIGEKNPKAQTTQILMRFPNGERQEHSFLCTDKIQSVYFYIDSLRNPNIGNYRLVYSFPRRIYGVDQMGTTLRDAGLYPRATLFIEPI